MEKVEEEGDEPEQLWIFLLNFCWNSIKQIYKEGSYNLSVIISSSLHWSFDCFLCRFCYTGVFSK